MPHHARLSRSFTSAWGSPDAQALVQRPEEIMQRLAKRVYLEADYQEMLAVCRQIAALEHTTTQASILDEAVLTGSTLKERDFTRHSIGLLLFEGQLDLHNFVGITYHMRRNACDKTLRAFPLRIDGPKVGLEKIKHTNQLYEYNDKFLYILLASVIMSEALETGQVPELCKRRMYIPTKGGFYMGECRPNPFIGRRDMVRRVSYERTAQKYLDPKVCMQAEAADMPRDIIHLDNTVRGGYLFEDEAVILDGIRDILNEAKSRGLVAKFCRHYISSETNPLTPEEDTVRTHMTGRMTALMNGAEWHNAAQHKHNVHKPRFNPRHG